MSTMHVPERPVFNSLDPTLEADLSPPISRLAVGVFFLGFVSLIAVLTSSAIPLAVLIAAIAAAVTWKLAGDASVGGIRLAQTGLAIAVLSSGWAFAANSLRSNYFYNQAGIHAKLFLETLSAGKSYEAFEMTLPEADRQITGTNLEKYFGQILATASPESSGPSPQGTDEGAPSAKAMKDENIKQVLSEFLKSPSTMDIISRGSDAKWQMSQGAAITWQSSSTMLIAVVMVDTSKPDQRFLVRLNRDTGAFATAAGSAPVALWKIDKAELVKE